MNYEIDIITISDGALVTINPGDIIVGMKSDASTFIVLRKSNQR